MGHLTGDIVINIDLEEIFGNKTRPFYLFLLIFRLKLFFARLAAVSTC
jgi:hypothetical protein